MKYFNQIGALAALTVIISCFLPWVSIPELSLTVTGLRTEGTGFGKPAAINLLMSSISLVLFLLPKLWAKRSNLFFTGFNLAWAIRNYIVVSACHAGICPEKQTGLYLLMIGSAIQMLMSIFPKLDIPAEK